MYNQFFGLQEDPFSLAPDPRFLLMTWRQRQVFAGLTYALMSRKRFVMLTGEIGTGKTTLLSAAMRELPEHRIRFSVISNPVLTPDEILEAALLGFGVSSIPDGKAGLLAALERFVGQGRDKGRTSAIVIDEAQKLSVESLRQIRLLGNLEFLQIVLAGQNELNELIDGVELRALKQSMAIHLTLEPLAAAEVGQYIAHRWTKAGGTGMPLEPDAVESVARYSRGAPRLINTICDNALLRAYEEQATRLSTSHVRAAAVSLKLPDAERCQKYQVA
jgi:general secretion pathway protein A